MRTRQISRGHQKLFHDLAARKHKSLFEEFDPFLFCQWMMRIQPAFECIVFVSKLQDFLGVDNRSIDLQSVANDTCVGQQSEAITFPIARDFFNFKSVIGSSKVLRLLQNRDPR